MKEDINVLLKNGQRDQAKFKLGQLKMYKQRCNDCRTKMDFIDTQTNTIEMAREDAQFTDILKDSNKVLKTLTEKIDMSEFETAKMLDEERKFSKSALNEMLQDEDDDEELDDILNKLEADAYHELPDFGDKETNAKSSKNLQKKEAELA